jgi:hypothetical protein
VSLPFLTEIRERERQAVAEAEEIFILGWSLPRTDIDQDQLIRTALAERQVERITVVTKGQPPEYFERIECLLGVRRSRLSIFNDGFGAFAASLPAAND